MADRDLDPKTLSRIKTARNRAGGNAAFAELVTKHRLEAGKETAMRADVLSGYLTGRSKRINDSTLAPIMAAVRETERAAYAAKKADKPRKQVVAQTQPFSVPATSLPEPAPAPTKLVTVVINGTSITAPEAVVMELMKAQINK